MEVKTNENANNLSKDRIDQMSTHAFCGLLGHIDLYLDDPWGRRVQTYLWW